MVHASGSCMGWLQSRHKMAGPGVGQWFCILVLDLWFSFNGLWGFGHLGTRVWPKENKDTLKNKD